jgi:hypothetical protein
MPGEMIWAASSGNRREVVDCMFNQRSADPLSVGNIPPNETAMLYIEAVEENGRTNAVGHRRARQVR